MSATQQLIGDRYDHEKFGESFRRSAYAMVAESYADPDTPTGKTLQELFVRAMEKTISCLPIRYYQMLEGIADGTDVYKYARGRPLDRWKEAGDEKLAKVMMEMTDEGDREEIHITEPGEAERYYNEKFPELTVKRENKTAETRKKIDLSKEIGKREKRSLRGKQGADEQKNRQTAVEMLER